MHYIHFFFGISRMQHDICFTKWTEVEVKKSCWIPGQLQGYLLGDSAYGLRSFLLTPYLHPNGQALRELQQGLGQSACRNRKGIWKFESAFSHDTLRFQNNGHPKAKRMLSACVMLHKICNNMGDHDILLDDMLPHVVAPVIHQQPAAPGNDRKRIRTSSWQHISCNHSNRQMTHLTMHQPNFPQSIN